MKIVLAVSVLMQISGAVIAIFSSKRISRPITSFIAGILVTAAVYTALSQSIIHHTLFSSSVATLVVSSAVLCSIIYIVWVSKKYNENLKHIQLQKDMERYMQQGSTHKTTIKNMMKKLNIALQTDASAIIVTSDSEFGYKLMTSNNLSRRLQKYFSNKYNGLISSVLRTKQQVIIPKIADDENGFFLASVRRAGFNSFMGAPIIVNGGTPVGVLALYSKRAKRYSTSECALIDAVSSQIGITLDRARLLDKIQKLNFESVRALVEAIEIRDPYTKGHSTQVAELSVKIASYMGFTPLQQSMIEFAGLLHDVGKIAIPEKILHKETALTRREWAQIKQHTELSAKIIDPITNLRPISEWILHHHERWDGSGYPSGKSGLQIPIESRILAVCDTYSAMTGNRPYRKALSDRASRKEIKKVAGTQLDPDIVQVFLSTYDTGQAQSIFGREVAKVM
ncbi:MAG: HD domain-containing protein [candidate division WOR-3 bacterium]|nr:MAG: HD domain-containing protein [candidate division WOR-3 bacterium]